MTTPTLVSVVTINRNTGDAVRRTIASVLAQDHPALEWVVVDGGSTDGSQELLRAALRPGDRFVSEPDRGVADAFNKGVALAGGEALLFMNAGDEFAAPGALAALVAAWDRPRHRWITGTAEVRREDGSALYVRHGPPRAPFDLVRDGCRIFHQGTLAERALFAEHGGFDESYRTSMDYDLWLRWLRLGILPQQAAVVVASYRVGGVSGDVRRRFAEERRARRHHGLANGALRDLRLWSIMRLKTALAGIAGPRLYRLKERLGW